MGENVTGRTYDASPADRPSYITKSFFTLVFAEIL